MSLRSGAALDRDRPGIGRHRCRHLHPDCGWVLLLIRAQFDGRPGRVSVRVDNQTGIPLQIDAEDAGGSTVGLGEAGPRRLTPFVEVPDIGQRWSFVAAYGGREVYREQLLRAELVADGWVVRIPASATAALERAGFR
jgi:hypothetical protein